MHRSRKETGGRSTLSLVTRHSSLVARRSLTRDGRRAIIARPTGKNKGEVTMTIRVVCYGLGPIGIGIARLALARAGVEGGAPGSSARSTSTDKRLAATLARWFRHLMMRRNRQRRCDGDAGAGAARGGAARHIVSARKGGRATGTNRQSRRTRSLPPGRRLPTPGLRSRSSRPSSMPPPAARALLCWVLVSTPATRWMYAAADADRAMRGCARRARAARSGCRQYGVAHSSAKFAP